MPQRSPRGILGLSLLAVAILAVLAWNHESLPADAQTCQPRPPVRLTSNLTNDSHLTVVVTAGVGNVQSIQFDLLDNVQIDVGNQTGRTASFVYTPPTATPQVSFVLRRLAAGSSTVRRLMIIDGCGPWQTLVGVGPGVPIPTLTPTPPPSAYQAHGLNFSPYLDGQDPNQVPPPQISAAQISQRLGIVAPYTKWIRTFGCTNGLGQAAPISHQLGKSTVVGAWLSKDQNANAQEIACVIALAQAGHADWVVVGSEVLLRGDLTVSQLIGYINQVKLAVPSNVTVTTADVYGVWLANPGLVASVPVLFVNYYGFWEGYTVDIAVAALHQWHQQLLSVAGGRPVHVSESGWPSCGNAVGGAVPSPANAAYYFLNFASWARANNVPYFYFSAFDEQWKAAHEGPQGACWGIWDSAGTMKPGMKAVFDGMTIPDNWNNPPPYGGPGTPTIEFTAVPPLGGFTDLQGRVRHVVPGTKSVVVYIRVNGTWWIKPTSLAPVTSIRFNDGTWTCDVTTGGSDHLASHLRAYMIPQGYSPPIVLGGSTLPAELDQFPFVEAARP